MASKSIKTVKSATQRTSVVRDGSSTKHAKTSVRNVSNGTFTDAKKSAGHFVPETDPELRRANNALVKVAASIRASRS